MTKKAKNKQILEKLDTLFNSHLGIDTLSKCSEYDPEKVKKLISKIIKFAFVKDDFVESYYTIEKIAQYVERDNVDIDEAYRKYLEAKERKGIFSWFKKRSNKTKLLNDGRIELDNDIDRKDIQKLRLPTEDKIDETCQRYKDLFERIRRAEEERKLNKNKFNKFEDQIFTYSRYELFEIGKESKYVGAGLTGNFDNDFMTLYGDERYTGNNFVNSPIKNSVHENLSSIKRKNDIKIFLVGDTFSIENGRHRLVYIINHFGTIKIPLYVTRIIEDNEFNKLLFSLKDMGITHFFKNNALNDEPNIFICKDDMAYVVRGKDELKKFSEKIENKESLDEFESFNLILKNDPVEYNDKLKYKLEIIKMCKKSGNQILNQDFSELVKMFEGNEDAPDNRILYIAFEMLQNEYSKFNTFEFDLSFDAYLENEAKKIESIFKEREEKIRE